MSRAALACAWAASVAPLALETTSGGSLALEGASLAGLSLLPWIALAGAPLGRWRAAAAGDDEGTGGALARSVRSVALWVGCALPPLVLGAALDVARGEREAAQIWTALGLGLGLIAALRFAAALALGRHGPRVGPALAWLVILPVNAAWLVAVHWAPRAAGGAAGGLREVAAASSPAVGGWIGWLNPLAWILGWASAEPRFEVTSFASVGPVASVALLLAIALASLRAATVRQAREA